MRECGHRIPHRNPKGDGALGRVGARQRVVEVDYQPVADETREATHWVRCADNGHSSSSEQPAGVHHPEQTSIAWSDPSSVSIRIPRSPYAALFLFTARPRSDVLTQEWRAAATAAPFD
jgi:hypothetical protein